MIRDFLRFLWRPTSENACIVIINVAQKLKQRDLSGMANYLDALYNNRVIMGNPNDPPPNGVLRYEEE